MSDSTVSSSSFLSPTAVSHRASMSPPTANAWVPDHLSKNCSQCNEKFSALKRIHHCKRCGYPFCSRCSQRKIHLSVHSTAHGPEADSGAGKPVRVCDACYAEERAMNATADQQNQQQMTAGESASDDEDRDEIVKINLPQSENSSDNTVTTEIIRSDQNTSTPSIPINIPRAQIPAAGQSQSVNSNSAVPIPSSVANSSSASSSVSSTASFVHRRSDSQDSLTIAGEKVHFIQNNYDPKSKAIPQRPPDSISEEKMREVAEIYWKQRIRVNSSEKLKVHLSGILLYLGPVKDLEQMSEEEINYHIQVAIYRTSTESKLTLNGNNNNSNNNSSSNGNNNQNNSNNSNSNSNINGNSNSTTSHSTNTLNSTGHFSFTSSPSFAISNLTSPPVPPIIPAKPLSNAETFRRMLDPRQLTGIGKKTSQKPDGTNKLINESANLFFRGHLMLSSFQICFIPDHYLHSIIMLARIVTDNQRANATEDANSESTDSSPAQQTQQRSSRTVGNLPPNPTLKRGNSGVTSAPGHSGQTPPLNSSSAPPSPVIRHSYNLNIPIRPGQLPIVRCPVLTVSRVSPISYEGKDLGMLELRCKDFRMIRFCFHGLVKKQRYSGFRQALTTLEFYTSPTPNPNDGFSPIFAYKYKSDHFVPIAPNEQSSNSARSAGSNSPIALSELSRSGSSYVDKNPSVPSPRSSGLLSTVEPPRLRVTDSDSDDANGSDDEKKVPSRAIVTLKSRDAAAEVGSTDSDSEDDSGSVIIGKKGSEIASIAALIKNDGIANSTVSTTSSDSLILKRSESSPVTVAAKSSNLNLSSTVPAAANTNNSDHRLSINTNSSSSRSHHSPTPRSNSISQLNPIAELTVWNGWDLYQAKEEYERLGFTGPKWRFSTINQSYALSPTYPSLLLAPKSITDENIQKMANFRSRKRLPAVCWRLRQNTKLPDGSMADDGGGPILLRSSQPMVGIMNSRNEHDELFIQQVVAQNLKSSRLVIVDARPLANAVGNSIMGAGYENIENYTTSGISNVHIEFLNIENIHVMRKSYKNLFKLCTKMLETGASDPSSAQLSVWWNQLSQTEHFHHLSSLIRGAAYIVNELCQNSCVFAHCSDGWDRTSGLVSLAELSLDPFYRTLEGFQILIEREWLSMGHKFFDRLGVGCTHNKSEEAPIFPQWIDIVWQMLGQFPTFFEFNEKFLIKILDELYSCKYGTFLFNNEWERLKTMLQPKTVSLWTDIQKERNLYLNPLYLIHEKTNHYHNNHKKFHSNSNSNNNSDENSTSSSMMPLLLDIKKLRFWSAYYLRWDYLDISASAVLSSKPLETSLRGQFIRTKLELDRSQNENADLIVRSTMREMVAKVTERSQLIEIEQLKSEIRKSRGETSTDRPANNSGPNSTTGSISLFGNFSLPNFGSLLSDSPKFESYKTDESGVVVATGDSPIISPSPPTLNIRHSNNNNNTENNVSTVHLHDWISKVGSKAEIEIKFLDKNSALWVPDHAAEKCSDTNCTGSFSLSNRRSHCRSCGLIFHGQCAPRMTFERHSMVEGVEVKKEFDERICFACRKKYKLA